MTNSIYAKAYTEVLMLLKCLNKDEYSKIPNEEIEFLQQNCDKNYKFIFDNNKKLTEQNVSKEANAILVILFEKYFASEEQKIKLKNILIQNYKKEEEQKQKIYNSNEIFKKNVSIEEPKQEEQKLIQYRKNLILKFIDKIKNLLKSLWKN